MVERLPERTLVRAQIQKVISDRDICVLESFWTFLVNLVGHCFRHPEAPIFRFYSLPARSRLDRCHMTGGLGGISASRMFNWRMLDFLGLGLSNWWLDGHRFEVKQALCSDGATFGLKRSEIALMLGGGLEKSDKVHVKKLISVLLKLLRREREPSSVPALEDAPLAIEG